MNQLRLLRRLPRRPPRPRSSSALDPIVGHTAGATLAVAGQKNRPSAAPRLHPTSPPPPQGPASPADAGGSNEAAHTAAKANPRPSCRPDPDSCRIASVPHPLLSLSMQAVPGIVPDGWFFLTPFGRLRSADLCFTSAAEDLEASPASLRNSELTSRPSRRFCAIRYKPPIKISKLGIPRGKYLLYLKNRRRYKAGSLVAANGILFFFTHTVPRDWPFHEDPLHSPEPRAICR